MTEYGTMYRILNIIDKSMLGGGQQYTYMTVAHLDRDKFYTLLACSPGGPLVEKCRREGIDVGTIKMNKKFSPLSMLNVSRLVKKERIDLIHSHGLVATAFAIAASRINGVPIIYSQHGYHQNNYKSGLSRSLRILTEKFLIRCMNLTLCDSKHDRERGIREGYFTEENSDVLYLPLQLSDFDNVSGLSSGERESFGITDKHRVIGTIGRLDIAKGYTVMLNALSIVREKFPDMLFLFVGDGEELDVLESKTRELGLQDHVRFIGRQPETGPFYKLFELFVSSSLWEGLPFTLCEAMLMKKAVVATRVGGCPEAVRHGETGLIVPPGNAAALAGAIMELLADAGKRKKMGLAGRKRVEEVFDVRVTMRKLETIYSEIISRHRNR